MRWRAATDFPGTPDVEETGATFAENAVLKACANADVRAHASPGAQAEICAATAAGLGAAPVAKAIFGGFGSGLLYTTLNIAFKGWKDVSEKVFGPPFNAGSASVEVSPALL